MPKRAVPERVARAAADAAARAALYIAVMRRSPLRPALLLPLSAVALLAAAGADARSGDGAPRRCLPLQPARVRLTGSPQYSVFVGYGAASDSGAASADTAIMLALDTPDEVCAESGRGASHPATRITSLQLLGAPRTVHALIGYGTEAYGRLAYALPGTAHAEVVLYVDSLPIPGTDSRAASRGGARPSAEAAR